ncbi:MAG: hypothetical protein A3G23_08435 [Bacteroidetes bacterium RIFCSPLOWO2_12_FULL_37_12]|nr:MAG: hypothetical protein A3G23_08435 [Bacteroidetes bacterium RIFCSPLOWO2_12_FULL_37_12]
MWNSGDITSSLSNISAGTYNLTITDNLGCITTGIVSVNNIGGPSLTLNNTNATCGNSNGTASSTVSGGTSPYSYLWNTGDVTSSLSNMGAGIYDITVTDNNGCIATGSVTVNNVGGPTLSLSSTDATCGNSNGTAISSVSGGSSPYSYIWSNADITTSLSNIIAGSYNLTVTDNNGCSTSGSVTVNNIGGPSLSLTSFDATCGNNNGSATVTVSGGTAPYSYVWNTGDNISSLSNIISGTYNVTVTDNNGCVASGSVSVNNISGATLTMSSTDATCGNADGSAVVTVSGGTSPYTYSWNSGDITSSLSNISAGTYNLTVTDNLGCITTGSVSVNNIWGPSLTLNSTDATCGNSNGTASSTVSGGTSPYSYLWITGDVTSSLSTIGAGVYDLTVTDNNGCIATGSVTVNNVSGPTLSFSTTDATCGNSNGTAISSVSGGSSPYSYLWSTADVTSSLTNISAGSYNLTVNDNNGCSTSGSVTVNNIGGPSLSLTSIDATCGNNNGSATVTVSGGTAPYSYIWNTGDNISSLSNISAGTYNVTVTDNNGCQASGSVTVNNISGATLTMSSTDATCGNADGNATVTVSGGTAPYSYLWNSGDITSSLSNISAGTYNLTVTDNLGCITTGSVSVNNIGGPSLTLNSTDATCGNSNGTASSTVSGGTSPYSYLWNTGDVTSSLSNISAGVYNLTVTDNNGCIASGSVTVNNVGGPTLSLSSTDATCGINNGNVIATVSGGSSPFNYSWSNNLNTAIISNLNPGTYTITITDKNGCLANSSIIVNNIAGPDVSVSTTNVTCGQNNGTAAVTISGGLSPYIIAWSTGQNSATINSLIAGSYEVSVLDNNNCLAIGNGIVAGQSAVSVNLSKTDIDCFGNTTGIISATISGGTTPYNSIWSNGANSTTISGLTIGTYAITITDASSCTASGAITLSQPQLLSINLSVSSVTCFGSNDGALTTIITGGNSPYSFNWSNAQTSQNNLNINAGNYTITVTDTKGCTISSTGTVTQPSPLNIALSASDPSCFGYNDGKIFLFPSGASSPYSYSWAGGENTSSLTNLFSGNYRVTVTDSKSCSSSTSVLLSDPIQVVAGDTLTFCKTTDDNVILAGIPSGGVWSGSAGVIIYGKDTLDVDATPWTLDNNFHTLTYSLNGCSDNSVLIVNGAKAPADTTVCAFTGFSFKLPKALPDGGIWTGPGVIDGISGTVNVTGLSGSKNYFYSSNGCADTMMVNYQNGLVVNLSASNNNICFNDSIELQISTFGGSGNYLVTWNAPGLPQISNGTINLAPQVTSTYKVSVSDPFSSVCPSVVDSVSISVRKISITITNIKNASCFGTSDGSISVSAGGTASPYSYSWNTGDVTTTLNTITAGTYSITVSDSAGCKMPEQITINQPDEIIPDFTLGDSIYASLDTVNFINLSSGGTSYLWNFGDGSNSTLQSPVYVYTHSANYQVKLLVTNDVGCSKNIQKTIYIQPGLSITEIDGNDILTIFPNPASEFITLELNHAIKLQEIQIIDLTGRNLSEMISMYNVDETTFRFDIKALSRGIYFLRLKKGDAYRNYMFEVMD